MTRRSFISSIPVLGSAFCAASSGIDKQPPDEFELEDMVCDKEAGIILTKSRFYRVSEFFNENSGRKLFLCGGGFVSTLPKLPFEAALHLSSSIKFLPVSGLRSADSGSFKGGKWVKLSATFYIFKYWNLPDCRETIHKLDGWAAD